MDISANALFQGTVSCVFYLAAWIAPLALILLPVRYFTRVPSFIFRKLMHITAFTGISFMILRAGSWQAAALTSFLGAAASYPVLSVLGKASWFPGLLVEKRPGEVRESLALFFIMGGALSVICWGIFGKAAIAPAAICMWGAGDAAAALVGIPFGKHKIRLPLADGHKSWEGSGAMLITSFGAGLAMLLFTRQMPLSQALPAAGAAALLAAVTELYSFGGYDTVTVPAAAAAVLLFL